jgi:tetratricopeptide (TPR) repeat protein
MALAGFASSSRAQDPSAAASPSSAAASEKGEAASDAEKEAGSASDADPANEEKAAREKAGHEALERATHFLDEGEKAQNDADRRRTYEIAAEHADRAVELLPDDPEAHFVRFGARGRLAQLDGIAGAALHLRSLNRELDEVLRLDPNHADALAARGGMLVKLPRLLGGDTNEGIRYLEKAVSLDPGGPGKRLELAEAYKSVDRNSEAMRSARQALALARKEGDESKASECQQFIAELQKSCTNCSPKAAGEG